MIVAVIERVCVAVVAVVVVGGVLGPVARARGGEQVGGALNAKVVAWEGGEGGGGGRA